MLFGTTDFAVGRLPSAGELKPFHHVHKDILMMKAKVLTFGLAFAVASVSAVASLSAAASENAPIQGLQRVYFNDQDQIIGESFRYCGTSNTSHWGVASQNSGNWVEGLYNCTSGATTIAYATVSPNIRATFCTTYFEVCNQDQPYPEYQFVVGPITSGLFSD